MIAGKYKLLNSVGEGGMGTVWMAEQRAPIKRLVAGVIGWCHWGQTLFAVYNSITTG